MKNLHSLLQRQILKYFDSLDSLDKNTKDFINDINYVFERFQNERATLEESLELNSIELLHANSEMNTLFKALPDDYFRLDSTGNILDYKPGSNSNIKYETDTIIGNSVNALLTQSTANRIINSFKDFDKNKSIVSIEYEILVDEKKLYYEARILPMVLEDQFILIIRDINDLKLVENKLKHAKDQLENRVSVRTKELANANESFQNEIVERKILLDKTKHQANELKVLYEDLNKRNKDLTILNTITQAIHRSLDLQVVYDIALNMTTALENVDIAMIYLVNDGNEAVLQAWSNIPNDLLVRAKRINNRDDMTWKVINTGKVVNLEDIQKDPNISEMGKVLGHHGVLGVPIFIEGEVIGVFWFITYKTRKYNEQEEQLLISIANQVGFAINNAKKAEAARQSEKKFRNIFDNIQEVIFRSDLEGNIVMISPSIDRYGFKAENLIGSSFENLFSDNVDHNGLFKGFYKGDMCKNIERKIKHIDGRFSSVSVDMHLIYDDSGKPSAVQGIVRDITQRKSMEQELQKVQRLESLGVLAGGIAHDYNNLLTAILGNISIAKYQVKENDKLAKLLTEAESASWRAKDLTQQLLTFSKGGEPIKSVIDLSRMIEETVSFTLRGSNVSYNLDIQKDLWRAEVDESQISQVINNLVLNAQQAMPQGGVEEIMARNVKDPSSQRPGHYLCITVKDFGVGIPEEYIQQIFDPYFTTKQKGSGLGLSTCYSIIDKHNGFIKVDSQIGKGTTFNVYIQATGDFEISEEVNESEVMYGRGKVLIMDDDSIVRETAKNLLMQLGYEVCLTEDGDEAIECYSNALKNGDLFDAVILDLTIPGGMGGKEALTILKDIDPEVKAIVSSGYSNNSIMSEYKKYGFDGIIPKPYSIEEVSNVLSKVVNSN